MLELQKFILNNKSDWKEKLKSDPFNLIIKENNNFLLFKYNQYDSDLSNTLVQECRGIILDKNDFSVACFPFKKFFNYGEPEAHEIDWKSAQVQTKIDGSIMKLWWNKYSQSWQISTNSCIDAFTVIAASPKITICDNLPTFGELFRRCAERQNLDYKKLDPKLTYIFELTTNFNEQVIHYDQEAIWHIGTRNNETFDELSMDIGIQKPKIWKFSTLNDIIITANAFKDEQEGFVVVDKDWNRVKIKSPYYVAASHHLNDHISLKKLIEIFIEGDYDEFLTYFPEYTDQIKLMEEYVKKNLERIDQVKSEILEKLSCTDRPNRKDFYLMIKDKVDLIDYSMRLYDYITGNKSELISELDYIYSKPKFKDQLKNYIKTNV